MVQIQKQMVFCRTEQWLGGACYGIEPDSGGLKLKGEKGTVGFYCMKAVDAEEKGFRWRRAVVEAELPRDTALRVYAYASDDRAWGEWEDLDEGLQNLENPATVIREIFGPPAALSGDFYLKCTGQYLWLVFELTSAGALMPRIERLRLFMEADHMTDYLPAIYREQDFTYRFMSIFDSMYADMERAIDGLPAAFDYESAEGEQLRFLASWLNISEPADDGTLRERIGTALGDYEDMYTPKGVARSVRRLTGVEPIIIEHFNVAPGRPECRDPEVYRRLYGEDPYRFFVLLPEGTFLNQSERASFQSKMEELIPAGMTMQMIELKQCVQLDWHTYLGINSRVSGYVSAAINEQVTIHYDTTIGGNRHE